MISRNASRLAWTLCATIVVIGACVIVLQALNGRATVQDTVAGGGTMTAAAVGALIASRRPRNPVGWFLLCSSMSLTLAEFAGEYAVYGLHTEPGSLPFARAVAWPQTWLWVPGVSLSIIFLPLYFPNGRLLSRRWRWVVRIAAVFSAYSALVAAFLVGEADAGAGIANPLRIPAPQPLVGVLEGLMQVLFVPVVAAAGASLVVRFWRSRGEERQQMKWLTYVAALLPALIVLTYWFPAADLAAGAIFASVPVVVGVAVLKYRLYDVDLIINRTLVYGALTVMLVLVYLAGVATAQAAFRLLTGQEQQSQLAVVASTLVIAALFNPLRRRVQAFIDRRFYRSRYDAARTLAAFGGRLRDETDLDALGADLVGVVEETMRPAQAALWLRPAGRVGEEEQKMLEGRFRNALRNGGQTAEL
jgi:hypothetical protein